MGITEEVEPRAITLIGGGARSGKSAHAQALAEAIAPRGVYVATGEARDEEMAERIRHHQAMRGERWRTVEAPQDLVAALKPLQEDKDSAIVLDCLTLWLSNVLLEEGCDEEAEIDRLVDFLEDWQGPELFIVTNEVGLGIVPDNALSRRFRDLAGWLNQRVARAAGRVFWMAFGCPLTVKE